MKLIALAFTSLFATINSQTIDTLVQGLIDQIYHVSDDGKTYTINLSPYYQATYNCLGEGFTGEGSFGNGNGVISFKENGEWAGGDHFSYESTVSGVAKSHPMASFYPARLLDTVWTDIVTELQASAKGISFKQAGTTDGTKWSQEASLSLVSFQATSKKYSATILGSKSVTIPSSLDEYWASMALTPGTSDVKISATAKTACMENPMSTSCSVKLVITGDDNGADIGKTVAKYSARSNNVQLVIKHDGAKVFTLVLSGIDDMEVLAIKYTIGDGKAVLAIQVVGPAGIEGVAVAFTEFITPFQTFVNGLSVDPDAFFHAVVYMDKVFLSIQGRNYFDFYNVIKATKFESQLLAGLLQAPSVQHAAKFKCADFNKMVEDFASQGAAVVKEARIYIQGVTSASGEATFDVWFQTSVLSNLK